MAVTSCRGEAGLDVDARCRIQLLGGLRVQQGDRIITRFRTQKTGALLAHLAHHLRQAHPREVLMALLWPESAPRAGRTNLRGEILSLRRQLEPPGVPSGALIRADRFSVQLNPDAVTTDAAEFEAALESAETAGSQTERRQCLADAVESYGGPLLPGYYLDWAPMERERLAGRYFQALQSLTEDLEEVGEAGTALEYARRAAGVEPLREEGHRTLIRLLAATGQPDAARRQYRELERVFREELGESPSLETRRLIEELPGVQQPPVAGESPPPTATAHPVRAPLPVGVVTVLLTEVEGARGLQQDGAGAPKGALGECRALLRERFGRHGGSEIREGDGSFTVAFARPSDALQCAIACQQAVGSHSWPEGTDGLRVRMALDAAEAELEDGSHGSPVLERATGLLLAAHGGQILCSQAAASMLRPGSVAGVRLADLGLYRLRRWDSPERLFGVEYPGMEPKGFAPPRAALVHRGSLPSQLTRFFGREEELARLRGMLLTEETRLVTLTGPPGSGKTRLALECARQLFETLHGAVWLVPLQDLRESQLIAGAVLDALGGSRQPGLEPLDQIGEVLSHHPSLLVLDNFEQLIEEGTGVVRDLLERVPTLTCLVTSRRGLDLIGESQFLVTPLPTPGGEEVPEQLMRCASVQLFVDRAQAVRPDFQVTQASAPVISELCDRLEGIPLALELAAARAQVLTPTHMLAQLRDRFDFLVSRKRDATGRHRTLQAAVDWSYQLLPSELRQLLARLSVFRGGWTVEAAEAVCGEPQALEYLTELEECSLIVTDRSAGETAELRFRMLETLQEYAAGALSSSETAALRHGHAQYYLALAEDAEPQLRGQDQALWLRRLEKDHGNFRLALEWLRSAQCSAQDGLRLASALYRFWEVRGHLSEGATHLAEMLALGGGAEPTAARMRALEAAGALERARGDYTAAQGLLEDSLGIARARGDGRGVSDALLRLGQVGRDRADYGRARAFWQESLMVSERLGSTWHMASSLSSLGGLSFDEGDYAGARQLCERALVMFRELADKGSTARCLQTLGAVAEVEGDYASARRLGEEALALHRELGARADTIDALLVLGWTARHDGDDARSWALWEEAIALARELGARWHLASALNYLGLAIVPSAEPEDVYHHPAAQRSLEESLKIARDLGAMQIVAYALQNLGVVAINRRAPGEGRSLLLQSIRVAREIGDRERLRQCLKMVALTYVRENQEHARGVRLMGAAAALGKAIGHREPPRWQLANEAYLRDLRKALSEDVFNAALADGEAMSWEEAAAYALEGAMDQSAAEN